MDKMKKRIRQEIKHLRPEKLQAIQLVCGVSNPETTVIEENGYAWYDRRYVNPCGKELLRKAEWNYIRICGERWRRLNVQVKIK